MAMAAGGHTLTSVQLPAILILLPAILILLLITVVNSTGELSSLTVAKFATLEVSPNLVVGNSPGLRPGYQVVCERVELVGLPRLTNLTSFFSSIKVKVKTVNSTARSPSITACFHRNASLAVGMCPEGQWEKLTNGSWVKSMSPFDHKLLDIRSVGPTAGTVEVVLNEEFYLYRVVFFVLGIIMMTFASSLSNSLATYYGGAMTLGVLLVVLVILFQGMRILPSGRMSSLGLVLYGSIVGVGSFLFSYVPTLLQALLVEMGIHEDLYSPVSKCYLVFLYILSFYVVTLYEVYKLLLMYCQVAAFLLVSVVLCGAWLGFWAVRKLVLTEDGSIDTGVAQFVAWSIRIVASSMILQCSVDPLLAVAALACGVLVPSAAKWLLSYYFVAKTLRGKHMRSHNRVEDSSSYNNNMHEVKLSDSNTFYSTFHNTPARKQYSKDEWDKFTKESTKKALESLVWSPDFNRWAVANADRLALLPKKDNKPRRKSWFSWS